VPAARAPSRPATASPMIVTETIDTSRAPCPLTSMPRNGIRPPRVKLAADAAAACSGRALRLLAVPELVAEMGLERVFVVQRRGDLLGESTWDASFFVDPGELLQLTGRVGG